jgi:hypothetical protein
MMRRLLVALTALVLIGGVAGGAMAQNDARTAKPTTPKENPNPDDQLPGCNPSGQQPNKCCVDGDGDVVHGDDADNDDVCDDNDNCPTVPNTDQADSDGDGIGDACDEPADPCANAGGDTDSDGVCDNTDNCDSVANPGQADADGDGIGDACEVDPCANAGGDTDSDGVCDNTDNCDSVANPGQADADGDGIGDACDTPDAVNQCTAATHDPGLLTPDTLGQTLFDSGLNFSPLFEDPEADGPLSGAIYSGGNGTPLEPITDEVACAVDLLFDAAALGADL